MSINLARIPILSPTAFILYLGMCVFAPVVFPGVWQSSPERPEPHQSSAAPANGQWTVGDIRRLPCGDDVPVVLVDWSALAYRGIVAPIEATASPVDEAKATQETMRLWFTPGDSRSEGRRERRVLVLKAR